MSSAAGRHILSVEDWDVATIAKLIARASDIVGGASVRRRNFVGGLLFLSSSLRTRLGFASAISRLGGASIPIEQLRFGPAMSKAESLADTVRVATGMLDVLVVRTPAVLVRPEVEAWARCPVINGGDGSADHPVQALIDLFAIGRQTTGPLSTLSIGLCGDLQGRSAKSLLRLLRWFPPSLLRLIAPASRMQHGVDLSTIPRVETTSERDLRGLDVLYLAGLPSGEGQDVLDKIVREAFRVTGADLVALSAKCVVLSPLPLIDEIDDQVRRDPRFAAFRQSDEGIAVRIAVLENVIRR